MWLAKDRNGEAYLYNKKPLKNKECGCWSTDNFLYFRRRIYWESKDLASWEDEEPLEVEIIIKKK